MSKFKFSFSFILAIFLVGILSTAAFATGGPYNLKAVYDSTSGGFVVSLNVLDNTQNPAGYKIDLVGKDASGNYTVDVLKAFVTSTDTGTTNWSGLKTGTATITPADTTSGSFTKGATYQVVLYDTAGIKVLEKEYAVYNVDSANGLLLNIAGGSKTTVNGDTITVDPQGTGLVNDNQTGFGNLSKARSGQKVHGFYQNNTNSCASCHQTHTAADGEYLLFKDGIYSTCSACHDGTTGAANSFEPADAKTPTQIAGTFDVGATGHNGSLHEADGSLNVSAAPGGNRNPDSTNALASATYGAEFDCASCHAAHGAGSTKENNLNLDPLGWGGVAYATTTNDAKNGKLFPNIQIVDLTQTGATLPTTESTPYILVKKVLVAADISTDKTKQGYMYNRVSLAAGDSVIQTYRWTGTPKTDPVTGKVSYGYVPDFSLFLRDVGHVSAPFANANTEFYSTATPPAKSTGANGATVTGDVTAQLNVIWRDGFVYEKAVSPSPAFESIKSATISLGIDVEDSNDIATLFDSKNANYVVDSGTEMSKYCAACHVDYASVTRGQDTGVYTTAHRHAVLQDRLTCVRCHFGHGTEAKVMKDANDNTYWNLTAAGGKFDSTATDQTGAALSYLTDPNPSSALKRYTGMAVCYSCHGKGEQFAADPNQVDVPLAGDPGAARSAWTTGQ